MEAVTMPEPPDLPLLEDLHRKFAQHSMTVAQAWIEQWDGTPAAEAKAQMAEAGAEWLAALYKAWPSLSADLAELGRLRRELDEAREELRGVHGANVLIGQRANLLQETCDRWRPVVEKAEAWRLGYGRIAYSEHAAEVHREWHQKDEAELAAAVDAAKPSP